MALHPDNVVFVACISKKVVGWIHVCINFRIESDSYAEIGGLVVDENYRGKGIGKLLVEEAERWAQEKKFTKLRVRSNVIRKNTHRFYLHFGYKEEKEQKVFGKTFTE